MLDLHKQQVLITKGLPGSGKSTWARELQSRFIQIYKYISKDDLRSMLDNYHWSKSNEKFVIKVRDFLIIEALKEGKNPIICDTNLDPKHEQHIRELIKDFDCEIIIKDFTDVSLDECIRRDRLRDKPVGEKIIRGMYTRYLKRPLPIIQKNLRIPDCVICDLDGTVALLGNRNPYDASLCEYDTLNTPIASIINMSHNAGATIVFVSGREEKDREPTLKWLNKYFPNLIINLYAKLYMRSTGDHRKDVVIKEEIYIEYVKNRYNVRYILDDRASCVDLWRNKLGLTCLQVADGNF